MRVGNNQTVTANNSVFVGNNNNIKGNNNVITGNNNNVKGNHNVITGNNNTIKGNYNRSTGNNNKMQGDHCTTNGSNNSVNGELTQQNTDVMTFYNYGGSRIDHQGVISDQKKRSRSPSPGYIEVPIETEKDEEAPEDGASCVICITSLPLCAVIPCGHKCICCKCARDIAKDGTAQVGSVNCPVCRENVEKIIRIY
jgi:hypothetical protein